ncbi:MAG: O-antigen ligase family protein, partial [Gloeomargarita sp. HHBFW_bins_162]
VTLFGLEMNWHPRIPGRVDSIFSDANVMASYCVMMMPVQVGLALKAPAGSRGRWGWAGAVSLTLLALVLTRSLNGLAVVWLLGMGVCLLHRRYGLAGGILLLGIATIGAGLDWPGWRSVIPELLWGRLPKYLEGQAEDLRTVQWQVAWEWFLQRPGWGWGLRYFPTLYQQSTNSWVGHPHNFWVMVLVETGVWATGLFTLLVGRVVGRGWFSWRKNKDWCYGGMWLGFVGITCFHLLDVTLFDGRVNGLAWLLLAGLADGDS